MRGATSVAVLLAFVRSGRRSVRTWRLDEGAGSSLGGSVPAFTEPSAWLTETWAAPAMRERDLVKDVWSLPLWTVH
jgi:hypothetical protein